MNTREDMEDKAPNDHTSEQKPVRRKKRLSFSSRRATLATFAALFTVLAVMLALGRLDSLAQNFLERLREPAPDVADRIDPSMDTAAPTPPLTYAEMDIHPDVLFTPYMAGPVLADDKGASQVQMIEQFRELLGTYIQRQGVDDNFTIRVIDRRNNETVEVFELVDRRRAFQQSGTANWGAIDDVRRQETNRLVTKWVSRGVPRPDVVVRWGRGDQVREARQRNAPFIEYEMNLARMLGLSLLPTKLATVETFNQDRLISSVGARSRYQMMPYILRQRGINRYNLRSASGATIQVFEEWHPLLTLEPAFITLRGYINSVGHEIPGISAYHTGPGNIYMVYRTYLNSMRQAVDQSTTVADAYLWAVTQGFDRVSAGTSFKTYSRGYVPSMYGVLKATDDVPIDTTKTLLAERVQLRAGAQIQLSEILDILEADAAFMAQNQAVGEFRESGTKVYQQFRDLNPHIQLPALSGESDITPAADVRFVSRVDNAPVRFFLPRGGTDALERAGRSVVDRDRMFTFDRNTFGAPPASEVTVYDRQYDELVADIGRFGFTNQNRVRLLRLRSQFESMAEANSSHYRMMQRDIIRVHAQIWQSGPWDRLASEVAATTGFQRVAAQPPVTLERGMAR
jgi:hypothetical protein